MILLHAAATWFLVGLIWTIQLVHYPLFAQVGERSFRAYHDEHGRRITWIVGPVMGVELVTGALLVFQPPSGAPPWALWTGLVLLLVIWGSTGALQVPLHARLGERFSREAVRALVGTNWLRTFAWTARGVLVLYLVY